MSGEIPPGAGIAPKPASKIKEPILLFLLILFISYIGYAVIAYITANINGFFTVAFILVIVLGVAMYVVSRPRFLTNYASRKIAQEDFRDFHPTARTSARPTTESLDYSVPRPFFINSPRMVAEYVKKYEKRLFIPLILWVLLFIITGAGFLFSFTMDSQQQVLLGLLLFSLTYLAYLYYYLVLRRHALRYARASKFSEIFGKLLQDLVLRARQKPMVELEAVCQDHGFSFDTFVKKIPDYQLAELFNKGDLDLDAKLYILKSQYIKPEFFEETVTTELQKEFASGAKINLNQLARRIGFDFDRMQRILYQYCGKNQIRGQSESNPKGEYVVTFEQGADPQLIAELDRFFREALQAEISGAGKKAGGKVE